MDLRWVGVDWLHGIKDWFHNVIKFCQIVMSHDHQDLKGEPASGPVDFVELNLQPATLWTWRDTGQTSWYGDVVLRYKLARIIVNTTFEDQLQTQPGGWDSLWEVLVFWCLLGFIWLMMTGPLQQPHWKTSKYHGFQGQYYCTVLWDDVPQSSVDGCFWVLCYYASCIIMPLLSIGLDGLHKIGHVLVFVDKGCFVTIRLYPFVLY